MGENEPKTKNFFETAAGLITGITALVVAVTGLIAALNSSGCFKPGNKVAEVKADSISKTNIDTSPVVRIDSPIHLPPPPPKVTKILWNENEEIRKESKSVPRTIKNILKQNPINIKISGRIIFPISEESNANYASKYDIILKIYVNTDSSDLWNIRLPYKEGLGFYEVNNTITLEKPEAKDLKFRLLFSIEPINFTSVNLESHFTKAILQKGFRIEATN
ncbi:MAG: hypothetical protein E6H09_07160 [Bacteroidetes bacterium]|nr:MAG: hypothetical protein E6H09_07160 [Bacteroidota bacterium]